jgi:hypothetical protein
MVEEILLAQKSGELYESTRLTPAGLVAWPTWLLDAAKEHDEHWLAYQIEMAGAMKHLEARAKPKGGYTLAHVPDTAAETLSEGQFNRFYIAAICRLAIEIGKPSIRIYRAKRRGEPRPESIALEGTTRNAESLLQQVRGKESSLKCDLLKPNSGLSTECAA